MIEEARADIVAKPALAHANSGADKVNARDLGVAITAQIIADDETGIGPAHENWMDQVQRVLNIANILRPEFAMRVVFRAKRSL